MHCLDLHQDLSFDAIPLQSLSPPEHQDLSPDAQALQKLDLHQDLSFDAIPLQSLDLHQYLSLDAIPLQSFVVHQDLSPDAIPLQSPLEISETESKSEAISGAHINSKLNKSFFINIRLFPLSKDFIYILTLRLRLSDYKKITGLNSFTKQKRQQFSNFKNLLQIRITNHRLPVRSLSLKLRKTAVKNALTTGML